MCDPLGVLLLDLAGVFAVGQRCRHDAGFDFCQLVLCGIQAPVQHAG
jgi:hypothetical protein